MHEHRSSSPPPISVILSVVFVSGAVALVYEVLWLKELSRLFGVTAHAVATTLAVFFSGLAAGSSFWGRRVASRPDPVRTYVLLEIGIGISALAYFFLLWLYRASYHVFFELVGEHSGVFILVKILLAAGILFPPAFFMGGTIPVVAQIVVRGRNELSMQVTRLYALNTAGAAAGSVLAGFYLPVALGFRNSYFLAIAANLSIAAILWRWRGASSALPITCDTRASRPHDASSQTPTLAPRVFWTLAAASGLLTLALEVLWTRMYAQVLQNSVYTFAAVLSVFLLSLGLGSTLAHVLCRISMSPRMVLFTILMLASLTVALTPHAFHWQTSGLQYLSSSVGFSAYIGAIFAHLALVLAVPGILIGAVFPYLLQLRRNSRDETAGDFVGKLVSINTVAAIAGSLLAGFVLLDILGLWLSIYLVATAYSMLAVLLIERSKAILATIPMTAAAVILALGSGQQLASVSSDRSQGEQIVEIREGVNGTVVVLDRKGDLRIKVDNSYLVGTSRSAPNLRLQSWIPLSLHPQPKSVYFLGMGTGITAGGALDLPVDHVVITELNPDIVELAKRHFGDYLNGLFDDSRVELVLDDGRTNLFVKDDTYDVIIADIFLTYKAGSGSLYTREHFETVSSRLAPGGLFAQWLPLFELSERELGIIARTMLEVFPQITVWRRGFSPKFPLFAFVASREMNPLDPQTVAANLEHLRRTSRERSGFWFFELPYAAYVGNLRQSAQLFADSPIATDDRPLIEYLSPITNRNNWGSQTTPVLAFSTLTKLSEQLTSGAATDPYLDALEPRHFRQIRAGLTLYRAEAARRQGRIEEASLLQRQFEALTASNESSE